MSPSTADQPKRIVIVGTSSGGAGAALALREAGFDGEVILIGEEAERPYSRPQLSKSVLKGEKDEPTRIGEPSFWASEVDWRPGTTVTQIRPADHVVVAGGEEIAYDKLVLATGAASARLDVEGAELDGVFYLRTLEESLALRSELSKGKRVVIIGGGWIGGEVAAAAHAHGADVTMILQDTAPLVSIVGPQIGEVFTKLHRDHGVDVRTQTEVVGLGGEDRVSEVRLAGGGTVEADLVVVAVGAAPNVGLADQAGLELAAGGVAVDATLATSDPDIYAVGDIAAQAHPAYPERVRVEHWANAHDQGGHVVQNLLGAAVPYEKKPFFFSDQYDLGLEYRGLADPAHDELVVRGDLDGEFIAFWLRDGAVVGALNVNDFDHGDALQDLIDSGRPVSHSELIESDL